MESTLRFKNPILSNAQVKQPAAASGRKNKIHPLDKGNGISDYFYSELNAIKKFRPISFCKNKFTEIASGVAAGTLSFVLLGQIGAISSLIGAGDSAGLESLSIAVNIARMPFTLATTALKVSFLVLFSFITPYVEEFLFRGLLHDVMSKEGEQTFKKGLKILANATIFTGVHIFAMIPSISVIALAQIFALGLVFSGLRALTESRVAPTAAHITFNTLIFGGIFALA